MSRAAAQPHPGPDGSHRRPDARSERVPTIGRADGSPYHHDPERNSDQDLADFLLARIAEDEAHAWAATHGPRRPNNTGGTVRGAGPDVAFAARSNDDLAHVARHLWIRCSLPPASIGQRGRATPPGRMHPKPRPSQGGPNDGRERAVRFVHAESGQAHSGDIFRSGRQDGPPGRAPSFPNSRPRTPRPPIHRLER